MKFLLTNDDGIDAPGLAALAAAAAARGTPVWVAPDSHLSGCGHRVTTDTPIQLARRDDSRYAIDGTPADCVRVGLYHVAPDVAWVLSGINQGGNLGADVYHSGTVAAVREAALHGKPGIAFSQYRKRGLNADWNRASEWVGRVLDELLGRPLEPGAFWNVNLPHPDPGDPEPRVVFCPLEGGPLPIAFRDEGGRLHYCGDYHARRRRAGTDVDVCFGGDIAVTMLTVAL
jgi:5'-nucleotidase